MEWLWSWSALIRAFGKGRRSRSPGNFCSVLTKGGACADLSEASVQHHRWGSIKEGGRSAESWLEPVASWAASCDLVVVTSPVCSPFVPLHLSLSALQNECMVRSGVANSGARGLAGNMDRGRRAVDGKEEVLCH